MKIVIAKPARALCVSVLCLSVSAPLSFAGESLTISSAQISSQLLFKVMPDKADLSLIDRPPSLLPQGSTARLQVKEKKSRFYLALLMALKNR